jgi:hypothetical protein
MVVTISRMDCDDTIGSILFGEEDCLQSAP